MGEQYERIRKIIQDYKDGYWEDNNHTLYKELCRMRILLNDIQATRLKEACYKYESLSEDKINYQIELKKNLAEIEYIIQDIEQKCLNLRG